MTYLHREEAKESHPYLLPPAIRTAMEQYFEADFSAVRIYVEPEVELFGASAFACGSSVHFAPRAYDLASRAGQRLLAHELAHVLQQRSDQVPKWPDGLCRILRDDSLEAEAEAAALSSPFVNGVTCLPAVYGHFDSANVACIQLAAAPVGPPGGPGVPPAASWARVKAFLTSPTILGAMGTFGIGLVAYQYRGELVNLSASAAALAGSKLLSPKTAAEFVINRIVTNMLETKDTVTDYAIQTVSGYAGLMVPFGGLIATPLGYTVQALWKGITPMQDFAIRVFKALPSEWRTQFLGHLALGVPKVMGAMGVNWVNRLGSGVQLVLQTGDPW
jgi:hypothetical protein